MGDAFYAIFSWFHESLHKGSTEGLSLNEDGTSYSFSVNRQNYTFSKDQLTYLQSKRSKEEDGQNQSHDKSILYFTVQDIVVFVNCTLSQSSYANYLKEIQAKGINITRFVTRQVYADLCDLFRSKSIQECIHSGYLDRHQLQQYGHTLQEINQQSTQLIRGKELEVEFGLRDPSSGAQGTLETTEIKSALQHTPGKEGDMKTSKVYDNIPSTSGNMVKLGGIAYDNILKLSSNPESINSNPLYVSKNKRPFSMIVSSVANPSLHSIPVDFKSAVVKRNKLTTDTFSSRIFHSEEEGHVKTQDLIKNLIKREEILSNLQNVIEAQTGRFAANYLTMDNEICNYISSRQEPGQIFDDDRINRDFRNLNDLLEKSQKNEDAEKSHLLESNKKRKSDGTSNDKIRPLPGIHARSSQTPNALPRESLRRPIIIIPGGDDPMFNMRNIKAFLVDGEYIPKADRIFLKRETILSIPQKIDGVGLSFKIIDNPKNLTPQEWDWVIAIICDGTTYQFDGWRQGHCTPVDIFSKHLGIYSHFSHEKKLPQTICGWNVNLLGISESQRYLDGAAKNTFWQLVEDFMKTRKSKYLEGWRQYIAQQTEKNKTKR